MLLETNHAARQQWDYDLQGLSVSDWMHQARQELQHDALAFTRAYRDDVPDRIQDRPLLLSGHQPQLFHAGVWFKNFVLASLGRELDAVAVNVLIDNDILRTPAIRVPSGDPSAPVVTSIPFDRPLDPIPYEERRVVDFDLFKTFGDRVLETTNGLLQEPLIRQLWPMVLSAYRRNGNLGRSIAEARHRLEGQWGQLTLEVPLSHLCRSRPFAWFVAHLLANLPRLQEIYNSSLWEYRHENRVRSRAHPVPDLADRDGWLEAPFWIWTAEHPHRRHLFARPQGDRLRLSDRHQIDLELPLSADSEADAAVEHLLNLEHDGIHIRPRALITTMYFRLALGDLFLHGIGGAKYDQLTDRIISRFFDVHPPAYLTLSATFKLFHDETVALQEELQRTIRTDREFRFHPEWHVADTPENCRLIEEKTSWLQQSPPRGSGFARHRQLVRINQQLGETLASRQRELAVRRQELVGRLRRQQMLVSREFSFCLFREQELRPAMLKLAGD